MICCKDETATVSRDVSITTVGGVAVTPSVSESVSASAAVSTAAQCHLVSAGGSNTAATMDLFSPARDCE